MDTIILQQFLITALYVLIFLYLLVGTFQDIKTREVQNSINLGILLASIPLLYYNLENLGFLHFAFMAVFFMAYLKDLGGADIKAIFPLIFIVPNVTLFCSVIAIVGMIYMFVKYYAINPHSWDNLTIPYFVPIISGYTFTMLIYFLGVI